MKTRHPVLIDPLKKTDQLAQIFSDIPTMMRAVAQRFLVLAQAAVAQRGVFTVALSGGSTPRNLNALLSTDRGFREGIPWSRIHFFFGDERHVPPEHPESNFRMTNETLFGQFPGESLHVHRIPGESVDAAAAAAHYEADLKDFFGAHGVMRDGAPRFDLILLGMGADGHTASLFQGTSALGETKRWVVATWVEKFKAHRITMTLPVLNNAAEVIVMAAGRDKSRVVAEVMGAVPGDSKYPVQLVRPADGIKQWMLDTAAASQVRNAP